MRQVFFITLWSEGSSAGRYSGTKRIGRTFWTGWASYSRKRRQDATGGPFFPIMPISCFKQVRCRCQRWWEDFWPVMSSALTRETDAADSFFKIDSNRLCVRKISIWKNIGGIGICRFVTIRSWGGLWTALWIKGTWLWSKTHCPEGGWHIWNGIGWGFFKGPPGSESQGKEPSVLLGCKRIGGVIDGFSTGVWTECLRGRVCGWERGAHCLWK